MQLYNIPVSKFEEIKFHVIGKVISASCYVIGWFMPYFFAGKLESGNVCEYFIMIHYFHELDIHSHDEILYEMGMKEKEHEIYFLEQIKSNKRLPFFEKIFGWGKIKQLNDINFEEKLPVHESEKYCKNLNSKQPPK